MVAPPPTIKKSWTLPCLLSMTARLIQQPGCPEVPRDWSYSTGRVQITIIWTLQKKQGISKSQFKSILPDFAKKHQLRASQVAPTEDWTRRRLPRSQCRTAAGCPGARAVYPGCRLYQVKTNIPEVLWSFLSTLRVSIRPKGHANVGLSNTQRMLKTEAALDFQKNVCRSTGLGQEWPEWHGCQKFERTGLGDGLIRTSRQFGRESMFVIFRIKKLARWLWPQVPIGPQI